MNEINSMTGKGNEWFVKNAKVYTCLKNKE